MNEILTTFAPKEINEQSIGNGKDIDIEPASDTAKGESLGVSNLRR